MDIIKAVELAVRKQDEGITYLYESTYQKNYYVALKYVKNEELAKDVLQDAYIKAFANIEQLNNALHFESWMSQIVARTALNELRKKNPILFSETENEEGQTIDETFEDDRVEVQPEVVIDKEETARLVREMMADLTDEQRICITMFYMENMSVREIAETIEVSENTVKSRLNYGRQKIKDKVLLLEKQGTKLYSIAPIPFFVWLLKNELAKGSVAVPVLKTVTTTTAATASASATSGTVAAVSAKKIIAGIVAVSLVGGTATGLILHNRHEEIEKPEVVEEVEEAEPEVDEVDNSEIKTSGEVAIYENKVYYHLYDSELETEILYEYNLDTDEKRTLYTPADGTGIEYGTMVVNNGYLYCNASPYEIGEPEGDLWEVYRYDLDTFSQELVSHDAWVEEAVDGTLYITRYSYEERPTITLASLDESTSEVNPIREITFDVEELGYSSSDYMSGAFVFEYDKKIYYARYLMEYSTGEYSFVGTYNIDGEEVDIEGAEELLNRHKNAREALQERYDIDCIVAMHYMENDYICLDYNTNITEHGDGYGYENGYYIVTPDDELIFLD